jgi:hypothetical protein
MRKDLVDSLTAASNAPGTGLAAAALVIARIEYPRLDAEHYLAQLDTMGDAARRRIEQHVGETGDSSTPVLHQGVQQLSLRRPALRRQPGALRGSAQQLPERGTRAPHGIPITLSLVYMEIGRRAGLQVDGINFPGHFLVPLPRRPDAGRPDHRSISRRARSSRNTIADCCSRSTSAPRSHSANRF